MKVALIGVCALWSTLSFAGHELGNGGDAVVCRSGGAIQSVELLDYFEGREKRGLPTQGLSANASVDENIALLLGRLAEQSPVRAAAYRNAITEFFSTAAFVDGTLVDIPDSGSINLPNNCAIEQLAVHQEPQFPGDHRYTIVRTLWDRLDSVNKAGLALHEMLYREGVSDGFTNSIGVRYVHELLAANRVHGISDEAWTKLLRDVGYQFSDFHGVIYSSKTLDIVLGQRKEDLENGIAPLERVAGCNSSCTSDDYPLRPRPAVTDQNLHFPFTAAYLPTNFCSGALPTPVSAEIPLSRVFSYRKDSLGRITQLTLQPSGTSDDSSNWNYPFRIFEQDVNLSGALEFNYEKGTLTLFASKLYVPSIQTKHGEVSGSCTLHLDGSFVLGQACSLKLIGTNFSVIPTNMDGSGALVQGYLEVQHFYQNRNDWIATFYSSGALASMIRSGPQELPPDDNPYSSDSWWERVFRLVSQPNVDVRIATYAPKHGYYGDPNIPVLITYYENGQLQSGTLEGSTELVITGPGSAEIQWRPLKNTQGKMREYGPGSFLFFSPEGLVDESKSRVVGCGFFGC